MRKVERTLVGLLPPNVQGSDGEAHYPRHSLGPKALVWITHTVEQAKRCGTRKFNMTPNVSFEPREEHERDDDRDAFEDRLEREERERRERRERHEREERDARANGDAKTGKK